jgi:hypothetical protein
MADLWLLLGLVMIYVIGFIILRCLLPAGSSRAETLALAFGLGLGFIAWWSWLLIRLGIAPQLRYVAAGGLPWLLALLLLIRRGKVRFSPGWPSWTWRFRPTFRCWGTTILLIWIALWLAIILFYALFLPMYSWDGRAIYAFKAKIFFWHTVRDSLAELKPEFTDPYRVHLHRRYPPLVPLAESYIALVLNRFDDRLIKIIFPFFFLSTVLLLYARIARHQSALRALLWCAILVALPAFSQLREGGAFSGTADVPLGFYHTMTVCMLLTFFEEARLGWLLMAAGASGLAMFTKNEGMATYGITVALLLLVGARKLWHNPIMGRKWILLASLAFILMPLLIITPWRSYFAEVPEVEEEEHYGDRLTIPAIIAQRDRIRPILTNMLREGRDSSRWGWLGLIVLTSLTLASRRGWRKESLPKPEGGHPLCLAPPGVSGDPGRLFTGLWLILHIGLYFLIFLISPWPVDRHMALSYTRILIPLAPVLLLFLSENVRLGLTRPE